MELPNCSKGGFEISRQVRRRLIETHNRRVTRLNPYRFTLEGAPSKLCLGGSCPPRRRFTVLCDWYAGHVFNLAALHAAIDRVQDFLILPSLFAGGREGSLALHGRGKRIYLPGIGQLI